MKVIILCREYLDTKDFTRIIVGGVQTYISNLLPIIQSLDMTPIVIQYDIQDRQTVISGVRVYGVNTNNLSSKAAKVALYKRYLEISSDDDVLLYAQDNLFYRRGKNYTIVIQHGIFWDITENKQYNKLKSFKKVVDQAKFAYYQIKNSMQIDEMVCVDYNYLNWFRTISRYQTLSYTCIPNFANIPNEATEKSNKNIHIVFARRFVEYRGSLLFANTICRILNTYHNVFVTLAGEGPDEREMHELLDKFDNVRFVTYKSDQSILFHKDKDIAVIPTTGSEGTSLSLLEAMAARCAVICTNVGGMTNIVIDQYNGLMIRPIESDLYNALVELIENEDKRIALSNKAYETVKYGFSHELWSEKWERVLIKAKESINQK